MLQLGCNENDSLKRGLCSDSSTLDKNAFARPKKRVKLLTSLSSLSIASDIEGNDDEISNGMEFFPSLKVPPQNLNFCISQPTRDFDYMEQDSRETETVVSRIFVLIHQEE